MLKLTPKQAAAVIGCTVGTVRELIRTGKLAAETYADPDKAGCTRYRISQAEAERYRDLPQTVGFPRGAKRK